MRALALTLLLACASSKEGGQSLRLDKQEAKTVEDEGSWRVKLKFGPPSQSGSGTRPKAVDELGGISVLAPGGLSAAPIPDVLPFLTWPNGLDHGPLLSAEFSGQLPRTTTTTGNTRLNEESWFKRAFKFGLTLWPYLLAAGALSAAGFVLWKLRPSWLKAVLGVFGA